MAINEVIFPTVPNPVSGDWAKAIELIEKAMQNINNPLQVDGTDIPQGSTFQVGGHVYYADGDTAISGTPSDYVKLTISGTILVPSFVANLSGVTWNKIWNGYYDSSDNYYIFDEVKAIILGTLSGGGSKFAELWNNNFDQRLKTTDSPIFADATINGLRTKVIPTGIWNMQGGSFTINHGLTLSTIRDISVMVRNDDNDEYRLILGNYNTLNAEYRGGFIFIRTLDIVIIVVDSALGGIFDSVNYNSTAFNRGWITITYEV